MEKNTDNKKSVPLHSEVLERYCHVIDKNTIIVKTTSSDNKTKAECMNREKCILSGGCKNPAFSD